jgi:iron-sulfur cluster repair protein YtfE (RIC family)
MFIEPAAYSKQTVGRFLGEDHDRLDNLFYEARNAFAEGEVHEGAGLFAEFQAELEQHMRMEEEILFPKFEELQPEMAEHGPTHVMRAEHQEIRKLLGLIYDILSAGENPLPVSETLLAVLQSHSQKEEGVLYRMIDELAGSALASELVHRMEAI